MTEAAEAGFSSTMVVSSKESGSKRTFLEELILTARSPAGWLLLLALIVTWSCVAVVLFDLLDHKTLAEYTPYCEDPCLPPVGGVHQVTSDLPKVVTPEDPAESTDWLDLLLTFASSLVAPVEEELPEVEVIHVEEL